MKWLMISAVAAVGLGVTATTVLRPHSPSTDRTVGVRRMSLQELDTLASVNKLPIEEFEDQSLVFSPATKR